MVAGRSKQAKALHERMANLRSKRGNGVNKENSGPPKKKVCVSDFSSESAACVHAPQPPPSVHPPPLRGRRRAESRPRVALNSADHHNTAVLTHLRDIPMNHLKQGEVRAFGDTGPMNQLKQDEVRAFGSTGPSEVVSTPDKGLPKVTATNQGNCITPSRDTSVTPAGAAAKVGLVTSNDTSSASKQRILHNISNNDEAQE